MLNDQIETLFFIAKPKYSFLSSSVVKEIALNNGDIKDFLPSVIVDEVKEKMMHRQ